MHKPLPLIAPAPPRLSEHVDALKAIEARGIYSNGGPVVRDFEAAATARLFGGRGACLALCSATMGLTLAIRHAAGNHPVPDGRLALVPAFTFAATGHAALAAGLTPLLYDADPGSWTPDGRLEEGLLRRHGDRIAAVIPYATFGAPLDLDRYARLAERYRVGVVIDAAASLGARGADGLNFGAGTPFAVVYSMHATKTFATAEGGLVHSGDTALIDTLRAMSNFGFDADRSATLPGYNAKLPEVGGLLARAKLDEIDTLTERRRALSAAYRRRLAALDLPRAEEAPTAPQFFSVLLPPALAGHRRAIIEALAEKGIGSGHYFSPHLGQQPYFRANALHEPTPVADDLAARILSLPLTDTMTEADVDHIANRLTDALDRESRQLAAAVVAPPMPAILSAVMIGGGPAGTAVLTAASKSGRLAALARDGLAVIERDRALGRGELGDYAIRSDSTAETFLSAVKDNPYPALAELIDHPTARTVARSIGALGVPLTQAGAFVATTGERLGDIVEAEGGAVLTGHEALSARRVPGNLWQVSVGTPDGAVHTLLARSIISATGGFQAQQAAEQAEIAGSTLGALVGDRLMTADAFLRVGGLEALRARLGEARAPRIAIVGASTSALASAALLLKAEPALPFGAGALALLHRHPLHPFFPSAEAAREEDFDDFGADDICPLSGFVYRLGGFRLESRELVLRMLGIGGRAPDPRVALHPIDRMDDDAVRARLDEADIVIAATGYRPHAFPLLDEQDRPIRLRSDAGGPLVDERCRIIDADGVPLPGAYAIGLAAGFVPSGALGGERSFRGQANGLWLWQNDVGQMIVDQVLDRAQEAAA